MAWPFIFTKNKCVSRTVFLKNTVLFEAKFISNRLSCKCVMCNEVDMEAVRAAAEGSGPVRLLPEHQPLCKPVSCPHFLWVGLTACTLLTVMQRPKRRMWMNPCKSILTSSENHQPPLLWIRNLIFKHQVGHATRKSFKQKNSKSCLLILISSRFLHSCL